MDRLTAEAAQEVLTTTCLALSYGVVGCAGGSSRGLHSVLHQSVLLSQAVSISASGTGTAGH